MSITKAQFRTQVRQFLDDPDAKLWTDDNLDQVATMMIDDLYSDILDAASYLNSMYQQIVTLHAPGYVDLRLTVNGGDLTQRLYRIQQVIADGRQYFAKDPRDFLMFAQSNTNDVTSIKASTGVEQRFSYQLLGNQLWLHPLGQQTTLVELRYSYRPLQFNSIANSTMLELPNGSELAPILFTAAYLMMKGNRESALEMLAAANQSKDKLLGSIRRQYHGMTQPFTTENAWAWGSI